VDLTIIISIITLISVIVGVIVNISTLVGRSESKAATNAENRVMLNNIYNKVDGIEKRQITIETTLQQHGERITKVEESAKSAHHRIDELKNRKG
jgi:peptidoglycan hydrolase CwlO-like protein